MPLELMEFAHCSAVVSASGPGKTFPAALATVSKGPTLLNRACRLFGSEMSARSSPLFLDTEQHLRRRCLHYERPLERYGHVVDIGGRGFGADAREVYEEGLFIPIMKLRERSTLNRTLIEIVRNNVRESDKVIGDIHTLAGCCQTGWLRLLGMLDEFGMEGLEKIGAFILENTRAAMLHRLAALPRDICQNRMTLDGYDRPVMLSVRVAIEPDCVVANFSGTSAAAPMALRVTPDWTTVQR